MKDSSKCHTHAKTIEFGLGKETELQNGKLIKREGICQGYAAMSWRWSIKDGEGKNEE